MNHLDKMGVASFTYSFCILWDWGKGCMVLGLLSKGLGYEVCGTERVQSKELEEGIASYNV